MGRVCTYLNFNGNAEDAFTFYGTVFKTEPVHQVMRWKDMPTQKGQPSVPKELENKIMHMELPVYGGHSLMGADSPEQMGHKTTFGDNVRIMLEPDTREETLRFYKELSVGGNIQMELQDTFWGGYYASFIDKFGTPWVLNCSAKK